MDEHVRRVRKEELQTTPEGYFNEENAERVVSWLVAAEDQHPVVLVGSGFTLNAIDLRTGNPPSQAEVPLWQGVVSRLANDLGLESTRYDAPFMAEMYEHAFGTAKLVDTLRGTVADDHLAPGPAHRALANYPAAAIVTMNCLDTVLDKACGDRFRTIVEDTDLSSADPRREILYLHGHRRSPASWVMTRSQYEDWPKRTPVMLTRARQLLAQHPWLVVGYSLSDLDFHAMSRLVNSEMRSCRPLSLVLAQQAPTAPERMHWRRLGYEIVHPELRGRTMGSFLKWALESLGTSYVATEAATRRHVERGSTKAEMLRRFRALALPVVDVEKAFRSWQESVRNLLDNGQREASTEYVQRVGRFNEAQRRPLVTEPDPHRTLQPVELDVPRLAEPLDALPQLLPRADTREYREVWELHLLWQDPTLREHLAEHFAWALLRGLFDGSSSPLPLPVITLRLARCTGWSIERLQPLVNAAVENARRYDDARAEHFVAVEATASGCTVHPAATSPLAAYAEIAKRALFSTLNGQFEQAAEQYREAADQARQAGRLFEAWTYVDGIHSALSRQRDELWFTGGAEERAALDARVTLSSEEATQLEGEPVVVHWLTTVRSQREAVLRDLLLERRRRELSLHTGNRTMRFSDSHHQAWRRYREVAFIFGAPSRQRWCFEPLEPTDPRTINEVLIYSENPKAWIADRCREQHATLEDRKKWSESLISRFFEPIGDADKTKTALVRRLECLPSLGLVLRKGDGPTAFKWLRDCATSVGVGTAITAFGSVTVDYWKSFSCVVRSIGVSAEDALGEMQSLSLLLPNGGGIKSESLSTFPWRMWRLRDDIIAVEFAKLLTDTLPSEADMSELRDTRMISNPVFTLLDVLDAGLSINVLSPHIESWTMYLDRVLRSAPSYGKLGQLRRSGFLLESRLVDLGLIVHRPVSEIFDKWLPDDTGKPRDGEDRDEVWTALAELVEDDDLPHDLRSRFQGELNRVLSPDRLKVWQQNPHLTYAARRLAIAAISEGMQCASVEDFVLQLYESSPDDLDLLADVVSQDLWSASAWRRLTGVIVSACGGGQRVASVGLGDSEGAVTRAQLGVLALCANLGSAALRDQAPTLWTTMVALALSCATEHRSLVANHAAFAVVQLAGEVESEEEANLFAATIDRMASDPRTVVRYPLASAALPLSKGAKHGLVRHAAHRAYEGLQADDNGKICSLLRMADDAASGPTSGESSPDRASRG